MNKASLSRNGEVFNKNEQSRTCDPRWDLPAQVGRALGPTSAYDL